MERAKLAEQAERYEDMQAVDKIYLSLSLSLLHLFPFAPGNEEADRKWPTSKSWRA